MNDTNTPKGNPLQAVADAWTQHDVQELKRIEEQMNVLIERQEELGQKLNRSLGLLEEALREHTMHMHLPNDIIKLLAKALAENASTFRVLLAPYRSGE